MNYPKISVVTPVLNCVEFLESTIRSVLSQEYPNLEYLIIDGGSIDGSVEIIKKYADKLAYWESEPDKGMYYALQKGFEHSSGEIMTWLNSDDLCHPNSFFIVGDIFSTLPDVEWIIGIPSLYNKDGICVKVFSTAIWSKDRFASGNFKWIQQESTFWRNSLWIKAGSYINTNYRLAADFDLWTRFFDHANLFSVNTTLSGFRLHKKQLSITNINDYESEALKIYNQKYLKQKSPKHCLIRRTYLISQLMIKSRFILFRIISKLISIMLNWSIGSKNIIFYDFNHNKWRLKY